MAALFLYQQSRGGIIDVEAEENKLLLVTEPLSEGATSEVPQVQEVPRSASPVPSPSGGRPVNRGRSGPRSFNRFPRHRGPKHASNS